MCGICREISFDGRPDVKFIQPMLDSLHERGPDAQGMFIHDNVGFGHRRLRKLQRV